MKVLVTGAAGFLGTHIIAELVARDETVVGLDNNWGLHWAGDPAGGAKITADITQTLSHDFQLDAVIHLAAVASPLECNKNPARAFNVNVNGTNQVLQLALKCKAKKFVFLSTSHVYGISPKYLPTDERHPLWLQDYYTTTKILGEELCHLYYDNHGLSYTALRLFNAYGPGQPLGYFIPDIIARARMTHRIDLTFGGVTKDFIFVKDVVRAVCAALSTDFVGPVNIGSGRESGLTWVAGYIAGKLGATLGHVPYDESANTRMQCDWTRAKKVLDWQPCVSLEEGLERTIEAWKAKS